jgi:hypothetical protein
MIRASVIATVSFGVWLVGGTRAAEPVKPPAQQKQIHETIDRAIHYLQTESGTWTGQGRCAACHHVAMPVWALAEADRRGFAVDKKFLAGTIESALGSREKMIAAGLVANPEAPPDPRPLAKGVNMGTVFMAVAAEALPSLTEAQQRSLTWITTEAIKKQREDGSWDFYLSRPPINENQTTDAAWVVMALQGERDAAVVESHRAALEKASAWLERRDPEDNPQVKRLKLLVALRSHRERANLQSAIDALLASQCPDGGWGQLNGAKSDAFATGQSLYVLSVAGYGPERRQVRDGIDYLLTTQSPDGSWPMASRATPDGRPGAAKLLTPITCGAASWATSALSNLAPKAPKN